MGRDGSARRAEGPIRQADPVPPHSELEPAAPSRQPYLGISVTE
jgi:hypothetical protein